MRKNGNLVEVYRAKGELEAQVIKSLLETRGIPCLFQSNAAPSVHVFTVDGMGEIKIMVDEALVGRASGLIVRQNGT
ncbi:MAG: DUF2007 domain-containing protein [Chloroflexi bacterium]|nr:DUF2007 domain-containing protein [Chloroflexota bacterium]MBI4267494.1 DUF2007 domain-containing protein [Chloroflexota bacterium]